MKLSKDEISQINSFWRKYLKEGFITSTYFNCYPFYKYFHGVADYHLVPSDFYFLASSTLNAKWSRFFLSHKANLRMFIPEENRPHTILYNIYGHFYNSNNQSITIRKASDILKDCREFVFKKAIYSGSGKGVQKISFPTEKEINQIVNSRDFIIQDVVKQNAFFSNLNESSVNTIRMETLNLNDTFSVLSAFVRIGAKGSFVDNISGREGMVVGISDQGVLNEYGLTKGYEKVYKASSGVSFDNLKITNYDQIKSQISAFHQLFPSANLINWDIAIDENGNIIILEINLGNMNPLYHQVFNGPVFHERLDEVFSFMKQK